MINLTSRQFDLVTVLREHEISSGGGLGMSHQEIGVALDLKSKSAVSRLIQGAEERGWVTRGAPKKWRTVRLTDDALDYYRKRSDHEY